MKSKRDEFCMEMFWARSCGSIFGGFDASGSLENGALQMYFLALFRWAIGEELEAE
jgi:hypothetical protein